MFASGEIGDTKWKSTSINGSDPNHAATATATSPSVGMRKKSPTCRVREKSASGQERIGRTEAQQTPMQRRRERQDRGHDQERELKTQLEKLLRVEEQQRGGGGTQAVDRAHGPVERLAAHERRRDQHGTRARGAEPRGQRVTEQQRQHQHPRPRTRQAKKRQQTQQEQRDQP